MAVFRQIREVEGLADLQHALEELPKATQRNVLRRILKAALEPMAEMAERLAPAPKAKLTKAQEARPRLKRTFSISTKLSRRQKTVHRRWLAAQPEYRDRQGRASNAKGGVWIFMGPAPLGHTTEQEFGTAHHGPQPYMRPAWDARQGSALEAIGKGLGEEIEKARKRLARKAERLAAKIRAGK